MNFDSPITVTALIATVLGVCFGFAAYLSTRRRKNEPSSTPGKKTNEPERIRIHTPLHPPPFEEPQAPPPEGTFFKQVGHDGKPPAVNQSTNDDDVYVWE